MYVRDAWSYTYGGDLRHSSPWRRDVPPRGGPESIDVPAFFPGNFGGYVSRASLGQGETQDDSRRAWVGRRGLLFEYLLIFT